jgi:DNA-directed RNA polymerase specialized sigma24 family protein
LTAEQVLPIIQQLPVEEKRRLREIDLETMSNEDFAEAMEAMAKAYRRRAGL